MTNIVVTVGLAVVIVIEPVVAHLLGRVADWIRIPTCRRNDSEAERCWNGERQDNALQAVLHRPCSVDVIAHLP